jgi:hypothetical protein
MQNFVHEMLHDSPAALKIMSLWKEYEDQSTAEARFVKGGYYRTRRSSTFLWVIIVLKCCVRSR